MDEHEDLCDFSAQTQRLVIQIQNHMKNIWTRRGKHRTKAIQEFNVRIANIIEWKNTNLGEELHEAQNQIETLNNCLDKQFEKKWKLKAENEDLRLQLAAMTASKLECEQTSHSNTPKSDKVELVVKM